MSTIEICLRIAQLCENGERPDYAHSFRDLAGQLIDDEEDADHSIRRKILTFYSGGMGSFNDLVLQGDGKVLPGNKELYKLRHVLYKEITDNW